MNDLLFYALLIALLYYCFIYSKKPVSPSQVKPLTQAQTTQTDPETNEYEPATSSVPDPAALNQLQAQNTALVKDQAQKERTIIGLNQSYNKLAQQFQDLQAQLTKLTQAQQTDQKETELALDQLIKNLKELNNQIE